MSDVITIGIAGGTGSGKTTITRRILDEFGGDVSVLYHDNYYKRTTTSPLPSARNSTMTTRTRSTRRCSCSTSTRCAPPSAPTPRD